MKKACLLLMAKKNFALYYNSIVNPIKPLEPHEVESGIFTDCLWEWAFKQPYAPLKAGEERQWHDFIEIGVDLEAEKKMQMELYSRWIR